MTIKEVSEKYGVSQDTLRYYERSGIIPPVSRTAGGIRDYQESDLGWVELSLCLRNAGVSVQAIAEYVRLALQGGGDGCGAAGHSALRAGEPDRAEKSALRGA